ncbi:MAG TPA: hypothetical protein VIM73_00755 [Polyangiaceae bacterium]
MNAQLLIDSIVRQTTVLIAQLATSGGVRAPLAHVANQVFLDLAAELNNQGVSRKVSAGMFGMALRSYLRRIQRLNESSTDRGRSLSNAVLDFLADGRMVTRAEVLLRFCHDDAVLVRAVLHDLTESGLLFRSGSGEATSYRAVSDAELSKMGRTLGGRPDEFLWAIIYRNGPIAEEALLKLVGGEGHEQRQAIERLVADGRVQREPKGEETLLTASEFVVPLGSPVGWEASVFDHFQAVVRTICQRLGDEPKPPPDQTGGSTYTFDVWPGHPEEEQVRGLLRQTRAALGALRARVEAHNAEHGVPETYDQVVFYCGQCGLRQDKNERE